MTASKQSQDGTGWNILTLLGSGHQNCMKLTNAECTVENS